MDGSAKTTPEWLGSSGPPEDYVLERFLTFGLIRLTNRLNRQAMRIVDVTTGLRLPEWRCLVFICAKRGITLHEIVDRTGMDRALITRAVQGLVEKGLVKVERDDEDRRMVAAQATAQGSEVYQQALPVMQARQARLLSALSEPDREAVYRIVHALNACLDAWPEEQGSRPGHSA
ncbi:MarR family winged helix-turn-helix transcriptional regulator [Rhabdaerophilum sp. SD176]|uniref:MarR family winged helix-turn-helix transcriptional regulator n=1 Tax=Rhabdaerophilum sp. SD176 TaxID=2983548 RepID=UPI0024DFA212|nr:MarR family winged helix-turn-helix transcriptional regulator [Rhabdaerophilum sp. SD176]